MIGYLVLTRRHLHSLFSISTAVAHILTGVCCCCCYVFVIIIIIDLALAPRHIEPGFSGGLSYDCQMARGEKELKEIELNHKPLYRIRISTRKKALSLPVHSW